MQSLSKVKIKDVNKNMVMEYTIVAEPEADFKLKKISINTPIAEGLLGKVVGDIIDVKVPNGIMKFEILSISR